MTYVISGVVARKQVNVELVCEDISFPILRQLFVGGDKSVPDRESSRRR